MTKTGALMSSDNKVIHIRTKILLFTEFNCPHNYKHSDYCIYYTQLVLTPHEHINFDVCQALYLPLIYMYNQLHTSHNQCSDCARKYYINQENHH